MHYYAYEMAHAVVSPMRFGAQALRHTLDWPFNPFGRTSLGRNMAAACEVFENITRRYGKPEFAIKSTQISGLTVPIQQETVRIKPFCNLLHFARDESVTGKRQDPKVLIIAPMSGHYATLLRGTVQAMIAEHDVFITDWTDARDIPVAMGRFDFDDFVDYIIDFVKFIGPNTHVIAVCQPAVPALVATALMASRGEEGQPASLILMGGPIDTRRNPTKVNELAAAKPIEWFERNVVSAVPFPHAGVMRPVYPGFMQLTGFMTMNLERHMNAHVDLFNDLVAGDCDSVKQHQDFYEEYLAVMDLTAEFYLQTVKTVFQDHSLPDRTLIHRNELVDCDAIRQTALMTVEGEKDDICGLGQTEAAQDLCRNIPPDEKVHYVQPGVGHYGVFNGTRWRTEIQPRIREFIRSVQYKRRVGGETTRVPPPYKTFKDAPDVAPDWKTAKPAPTKALNGAKGLNGANGKHPPVVGE
ncbi:MAG: polyhydroxyalkanoate depolymerase [Hyphomicrobium sp.]